MARKLAILHIEDREDDALLFKWSLTKDAPGVEIHSVRAVEEAKKYLLGAPPYDDRVKHPVPDLIVSDLTLPGGSGFEFLEWRKQNCVCQDTPVVVLSNSNMFCDKRQAFKLGATHYYAKPLSFQGWQGITRDIFYKWVAPAPKTRKLEYALVSLLALWAKLEELGCIDLVSFS